jgi:hypothetical protein
MGFNVERAFKPTFRRGGSLHFSAAFGTARLQDVAIFTTLPLNIRTPKRSPPRSQSMTIFIPFVFNHIADFFGESIDPCMSGPSRSLWRAI